METGFVVVEKVRGKSTVTQSFSKYPLKLIIPNKVGSMDCDAVWIYSLSYGGGIVSGDCVSCGLTVGDGCTTVFTTQSSTKVYKSVGLKCSEQYLEKLFHDHGHNKQRTVMPNAYSDENVILNVPFVGSLEVGQNWKQCFFGHYSRPSDVFLNCQVLLEGGGVTSIAERMQGYQVIAMVILVGPKLKQLQIQVQEDVKRMMHDKFYVPSNLGCKKRKTSGQTKPDIIASCSTFGPKGVGVVIRISAITTESIYEFLRHHLASMEPLLGAAPYH